MAETSGKSWNSLDSKSKELIDKKVNSMSDQQIIDIVNEDQELMKTGFQTSHVVSDPSKTLMQIKNAANSIQWRINGKQMQNKTFDDVMYEAGIDPEEFDKDIASNKASIVYNQNKAEYYFDFKGKGKRVYFDLDRETRLWKNGLKDIKQAIIQRNNKPVEITDGYRTFIYNPSANIFASDKGEPKIEVYDNRTKQPITTNSGTNLISLGELESHFYHLNKAHLNERYSKE
jgi:hypothetical protein